MDTPRKGTSKNPALARQLILEAAVRRFSEVGYRAARMSDVARVAGYSEATVFHHFGTKADLFRAVVAHLDAGQRWFDPEASPDDLPQQLHDAELAYHHDGRWTMLDRAWSDAQGGEEDLLGMIRPALWATIDHLGQVLRRAGTGSDPDLLARWLLVVSYGSRVMRRYDPAALTPEDSAALLRLTAELATELLRREPVSR